MGRVHRAISRQVSFRSESFAAGLLAKAESFIEPDCSEILIYVVARADLPALHVAVVRYDAVAPQQKDFMRLSIENVLLELAHKRALLREIRFAQQSIIDLDRLRVLVPAVVRR